MGEVRNTPQKFLNALATEANWLVAADGAVSLAQVGCAWPPLRFLSRGFAAPKTLDGLCFF